MTKLALEIVHCPLCASSDSRAWGEENGFTGVKCLECGLVYVSPRPTSESIDEATKLGVHQVTRARLRSHISLIHQLLQFIAPRFRVLLQLKLVTISRFDG